MRILVISNLYPPEVLGGYEILCAQVCEELSRRGHVVTVLTTGEDSTRGDPRSAPRVVRSLELYVPFSRAARAMRLRKFRTDRRNSAATEDEILSTRPDVIFLWSLRRLGVGPARSAEASGAPVLYALNDDYLLAYRPAQRGHGPRKLLRWLVDHFLLPSITLRGLTLPHATCISRSLQRTLEDGGATLGNCELIHQGIPLNQFPCKVDPGSIQDPPRILYTGQLHAYKGPHTLIEAAALLAKKLKSPPRLTLAGKGDPAYMRELAQLALRRGVEADFRGHVAHEALPPLYRESDLFVFPSVWNEPFGLTLLEAMASGTPVVSTAHGGQGEILRPDENALVFEKEDAQGLASQLLRLCCDANLRRRLALNGRRLVEEKHSLTGYVDQLEQLLARINATGRRPHFALASSSGNANPANTAASSPAP